MEIKAFDDKRSCTNWSNEVETPKDLTKEDVVNSIVEEIRSRLLERNLDEIKEYILDNIYEFGKSEYDDWVCDTCGHYPEYEYWNIPVVKRKDGRPLPSEQNPPQEEV